MRPSRRRGRRRLIRESLLAVPGGGLPTIRIRAVTTVKLIGIVAVSIAAVIAVIGRPTVVDWTTVIVDRPAIIIGIGVAGCSDRKTGAYRAGKGRSGCRAPAMPTQRPRIHTCRRQRAEREGHHRAENGRSAE